MRADSSTALALATVALATVTAVSATGELHWAFLPLALCGALEAPTVLRWLRGRCDPFDPKALVSLLALQNTFVAPMLHLTWNWYTPLIRVPSDPPEWFGRLAVVHFVALLALEGGYAAATGRPLPAGPPRVVSRSRLLLSFSAAAAVALAAQVYFFERFGGLAAMIAAYEARDQSFTGTGWMLMLAWPFCLILFVGWAVIVSLRPARRRVSLTTVVIALLVFAVAHLAWSGLRGNRLSTIGGVFLAAAFCHFLVRRLTMRVVVAGFVAMLGFSFLYNFYKGAGRTGITTAVSGSSGLASVQQQTRRDFRWLLLGDLARADIQMEVLQTIVEANPDYRLRWGETYIGAAVFIPRNLWPTRPRGAQEAYEELQNGHVGVALGAVPNSRVFGLTGETLLNFGWAGVPIVYGLFGLLIGLTRRMIGGLKPGDGRLLLAPPAVLLVVTLYLFDLSQVVHMFFQDAALLMACTLFSLRPARRASTRYTRGAAPAAARTSARRRQTIGVATWKPREVA